MNLEEKKLVERKNLVLCEKYDEGVMLKMWWPYLITICDVQVQEHKVSKKNETKHIAQNVITIHKYWCLQTCVINEQTNSLKTMQ